MLIALIIGIAIGYAAFAPEMEPTRKTWWAKVNEMVATAPGNSSSK
jgi:hypothetical protein